MSASLSVAPLKLYFGPDTVTATLTITNGSEQPVSVQITAKSWLQGQEGEDFYEATADVIFFPKIVQIEPAEERAIRVAYQGGSPEMTEKTYRLFVQELPVQEPGEFTMKFVVRMGIPIFVRPSYQNAGWHLAAAKLVEKGLKVRVDNSGSQHLMVANLQVTGRDARNDEVFSSTNNGWYVLADHGRAFILPIDNEQCSKVNTLHVSVTADEATREQQLELAPGDCSVLQDPEHNKDFR